MFSLGEIVGLAIQIEQNGERAYRTAAKRMADRSLAAVLKWLADEEQKHIRFFTALKPAVAEFKGSRELEESGQALLRAIVGDQTFSIADADFGKIHDVKGLLKVAIEFEKDTILFYQMLRSAVSEEQALAGLDKIIGEENQHVKILKEIRLSDFGDVTGSGGVTGGTRRS